MSGFALGFLCALCFVAALHLLRLAMRLHQSKKQQGLSSAVHRHFHKDSE